MNVSVRLFAGLRDRAGATTLALDLPDGARVGDALAQVRWLTEDIPVVMAVNLEYADASATLAEGDELALIPPISGGAGGVVRGRVVDRALSLDALVEAVRDPRAGAVVTFSGVTREVPALEYEAYAEMAQRRLTAIVESAVERHRLCAAAVDHRIGVVALSEASVIIAVSAPHRAEAFTGAREIIDTLKREVPIWKREEGEWVEGVTPTVGSEAVRSEAVEPTAARSEAVGSAERRPTR